MYIEINAQNGGVSMHGWGNINASELNDFSSPSLLIAGEEDIVCSPGRLKALNAEIDGSELVTVPESGHSVYFERTELFNRSVDRFLSRTYPAGSDGRTIVHSFSNPTNPE